LSFESADVQPVRASVWQVQPVKLAYAREMFEDEEKRLVWGEIVLRGVTAFVGVGGGGGGIA